MLCAHCPHAHDAAIRRVDIARRPISGVGLQRELRARELSSSTEEVVTVDPCPSYMDVLVRRDAASFAESSFKESSPMDCSEPQVRLIAPPLMQTFNTASHVGLAPSLAVMLCWTRLCSAAFVLHVNEC